MVNSTYSFEMKLIIIELTGAIFRYEYVTDLQNFMMKGGEYNE